MTDDERKAMVDLYHALCALLTAPKTKTVWHINGCGRARAPYERDHVALTVDEIAGYVADLHAEGFGRITIITDEVPA